MVERTHMMREQSCIHMTVPWFRRGEERRRVQTGSGSSALFGHAVSGASRASCGLMGLDQSSRCAVEITGTTNSLTAPYLKSFEGDDPFVSQ